MSQPSGSNTMSPPTESRAANEVFAIPELLEMVLLDSSLPPHQLFALQRVDKTFAATIQGSKKIRRRMCLEQATNTSTTSTAAVDSTVPAPTTSSAAADTTTSSKKGEKAKGKGKATSTASSSSSSPEISDAAWNLLGFQAHKQGKRTLTRVSLPIVLNIYKSTKFNAVDVRLADKEQSVSECLKALNETEISSSWKDILIGTSAFQDERKLEVRIFADKEQVSYFYEPDHWAQKMTMGDVVEEAKDLLWVVSDPEELPRRMNLESEGVSQEASKNVEP